jgi:hypothetical protein
MNPKFADVFEKKIPDGRFFKQQISVFIKKTACSTCVGKKSGREYIILCIRYHIKSGEICYFWTKIESLRLKRGHQFLL